MLPFLSCSPFFLLLSIISVGNVTGLSSAGSSNSIALPKFIGFDLGTSGARISVIENNLEGQSSTFREIYTQAVSWGDPSQKPGSSSAASYDDPSAWMNAVESLLEGASQALFGGESSSSSSSKPLTSVKSICVSGTSASCLIVDVKANKVTRKPRMYNYDVVASRRKDEDPIYAVKAMSLLDKYAPERHTARAQSGSLAKLLTWNEEKRLHGDSEVLCHQADYVSMRLQSNDRACGAGPKNTWTVSSDWHNCLKLGYDVQNLEWPDWMKGCLQEATGMDDPTKILPHKVVSPGQPMGTISSDIAERFGLSKDTVIVGGTTDSNAAFFAAAGAQPKAGLAVTSLGSTLAIKYLSQSYVEDADRGVYSHRFPSVFSTDDDDDKNQDVIWLAGGASNVGCAVLRQEEFSNEELVILSAKIDPNTDSSLDYYPLVKKGERFPVADSAKEPVLTPVPESRREYLHGILQGISNVERDGFQILGELGAIPARPKVVLTCGGGSRNDTWSRLRERRLNETFGGGQEGKDGEKVKILKAENTEASFGAAILAAAAFS